MALKLQFDHPEMPKGEEFDVCGVLVENGGSVELTEAQEYSIAARYHKSARDALSGSAFVKVTGTALLTNKDIEDYLQEPETTPADTAETTEAVDGGDE